MIVIPQNVTDIMMTLSLERDLVTWQNVTKHKHINENKSI